MARSKSKPKPKRPRVNYAWYRIVCYVGTQRTSAELPGYLHDFIADNRYSDHWGMKNAIKASALTRFRQMIESIPRDKRPYSVEAVTPTGLVIYRWCRVEAWETRVSYTPPRPTVDKHNEAEWKKVLDEVGEELQGADKRPVIEVCKKK